MWRISFRSVRHRPANSEVSATVEIVDGRNFIWLFFFFAAEFLHLIFPHLVAQTAYTLFYSYVGQHTSVGNYWNDPHEQNLYYEYSSFLPYINNEIKTENSTRFRGNLLRVGKMILIGGPNDGVITPWESRYYLDLYISFEKIHMIRFLFAVISDTTMRMSRWFRCRHERFIETMTSVYAPWTQRNV